MSPRVYSRAIVLFHERVKLHDEAVKKPFLPADASLLDGLLPDRHFNQSPLAPEPYFQA
jgi:hypothetical protein